LDVGRLKRIASQNLQTSPVSLKTISTNEGGCVKRVVFQAKMKLKREDCALKCFVCAPEDLQAKKRVEKETALAEWASREGIGVPVRSVLHLPETTILVMTMALGDLEGVLRARQHLSYNLIRDLFKQAFRLVTHEKLISKGLVCADFKPANFLVLARESRNCVACDLASVVKKGGASLDGCSLELRLVDFDPFFWSKTNRRDAIVLNNFFLFANSVLWKTPYALAPYMPDEAFKIAEAVKARDPKLVDVLSNNLRLLRRGPLHYSSLAPDCKTPLEALLTRLSEASTIHGFSGAHQSTRCGIKGSLDSHSTSEKDDGNHF